MKNVHQLFTLIALSFITVSWWSCGASDTPHIVSGNITNASPGTILFFESLVPQEQLNVDSAVVDDEGNFHFDPKITTKAFYRIRMGKDNAIILIMDSTERVTVQLDATNFSSQYSVSGSQESEWVHEFSQMVYNNVMQKDSLNEVFRSTYDNNNITEEIMQSFSTQLSVIETSFKEGIEKFIQSHPGALANLAAIEQLTVDDAFETYQLVDAEVGKTHGSSPFYNTFHQRFEYESKFTVGKPAPEILLPDPDGETASLTSLRGKIVLLDFWASWCRPCRVENPNVVRLYNQYKGENFEIFSVSLDRDRSAWLKAIQDDKMTWKHASDLMFWQSPVVKLYNIKGIPHTILINEEGIIIAKNLRGRFLADKLAELFG